MKKKDLGKRLSLEATIVFSYDREQLAQLAGAVPVAGMLALEIPCPQTMRLKVTKNFWQLDLDEPTLFGSAMTLIHYREGGAEYLDHKTRTRLKFDAKEVPSAKIKRPGRWRVENLSASDPKKENDHIDVILEDIVTEERWIQRIYTGVKCDDVELVGSFIEALLNGSPAQQTLQYPIEHLVALVAKRGLPREINLYAEGSDTALSSIKITQVVFGAESPRRRDWIRYRDLRDPDTHKIWSKPRPGLREVASYNLEEFRAFDNGRDTQGDRVIPRMLPYGQPGREPPEPGEDRPRPPSTLTTNAAQVALRIEQRLLEDIQRTVNSIAAHLNAVTTNGTDLVIHWLEDIVSSSRQINPTGSLTVEGTGLAALLHEDPGTKDVKRCKLEGGRGLIDRMAASRARKFLVEGNIPDHILSALSQADQAALSMALTFPDPRWRFISLASRVRTNFIAAVAFEDIGTLRFSLARMRDSINFHDLYMIQLTDFSASLGFPPATGVGMPLEAPLVSGLRCRAGGEIGGEISIAGIGIDATMIRTPLPLYGILVVAGSPLIPIFFPQFAWVIPILWSISLFLATDYARLRLDSGSLRAAFNIRFLQTASSLVLRPRVSVRLFGSIQTRMLSYVPDGIHQLIYWSLSEFANQFGATLSLLEGQLTSALQKLLDAVMGDGVPGGMLRLGIPLLSSQALGEDDKYVYLESTFDTPANPAIQIMSVPVSAALRFDLDRDIAHVFGLGGGGGRGRHYLSFAGSINAVNQVAAVLCHRGEFNTSLTGSSAIALRSLLAAPFSGPVVRIDTYHTSPTFSLPPGGPTGPQHYFDVVFPSFVIVVNRDSDVTWLFRYRITGRGVFGLGAVPAGGHFLSISGMRSTVFEAMLDLNSATATLLEATQIEKSILTVEEPGLDTRHPQVIHTYEEVIEKTTDHTLTAPTNWTAYGRGVFILTNSRRDVGLVPRLDQRKTEGAASNWPLDAVSQQTYGVDGSDPDDSEMEIQGITTLPYAHLPVDWGFIQGLSFAHLEVSGGLQQILSGSRHLNSFMKVEAELLYPFLDRLLPSN